MHPLHCHGSEIATQVAALCSLLPLPPGSGHSAMAEQITAAAPMGNEKLKIVAYTIPMTLSGILGSGVISQIAQSFSNRLLQGLLDMTNLCFSDRVTGAASIT